MPQPQHAPWTFATLAVALSAVVLSAVVTACTTAPASFDDCAGLSDPTAREDCRLDFARQLLDDPAGLQAAIDAVQPTESRDLLLLRLAVAEPTRAAWLCTEVEGAGAAEKCRQVLGRPHLSTPPQAPRGAPEPRP